MCWSVCLLVTTMSRAKTTEPIALWTWVGPKIDHILGGAQITPRAKGQFLGCHPLKYIRLYKQQMTQQHGAADLSACHFDHTHTRLTALFPGLPRWASTNLDFTEARDSEWQWHQLRHMQVCTLLQTDNYTSTPPVCFLQAGCLSCCPTNSVKALKALWPLVANIFWQNNFSMFHF